MKVRQAPDSGPHLSVASATLVGCVHSA
jgi:hypothetical protein